MLSEQNLSDLFFDMLYFYLTIVLDTISTVLARGHFGANTSWTNILSQLGTRSIFLISGSQQIYPILLYKACVDGFHSVFFARSSSQILSVQFWNRTAIPDMRWQVHKQAAFIMLRKWRDHRLITTRNTD